MSDKAKLVEKAQELIEKIQSLSDDGSEGYPWSQDELDLIVLALSQLEASIHD